MVGRFVLAVLFIFAGLLHFLNPGQYLRIVPPFLPWPAALVAISGAAEIAGGMGLLFARWRSAAAYGLIVLLIAVYPANIYMAVEHARFTGWPGQPWFHWVRLPLQFLLMAWAWRYTGPQALANVKDFAI
jgi:uncharacterized membrane protein